MKLIELVHLLDPTSSRFDVNAECVGFSCDSRRIKPGDLFLAYVGETDDGHAYVDAAIERGAAAIVLEDPFRVEGKDIPWIAIPDGRWAHSALSDLFAGNAARELDIVGITGTNGKSTTSYLVASAIQAAGRKTGLLSTIEYRVGESIVPATETTPGPHDLHRYFRSMRNAGMDTAVMEVSSHALVQKRVAHVPFRVGVFTNLTQDHLDYHGTLENYRDAKALLFRSLDAKSTAVLNAGDDASRFFAEQTQASVLRYAVDQAAVDVCGVVREMTHEGTTIEFLTPRGQWVLNSRLVGRHNAENLLAAVAVSEALELDPEKVRAGLEAMHAVPGRLEAIDEGQPFGVYVDYAHTDDALRNVLEAVRPLTDGRVLVVFGCGGDRDRGKRPKMARAAESLADVVYVTSDNPRTEDPERILDDVVLGLERPEDAHVEVDRRMSIQAAIGDARQGDIVLIAGKGHEDYQILGKEKIHFDDCEEARKALCTRRWKERGGVA